MAFAAENWLFVAAYVRRRRAPLPLYDMLDR